jgi:outer membrane protein TolC
LLAKAAVQVAEESVVQTKALVAQTEEKQRMGRAAEFDTVSARVRLSNEVPVLLRARNRLAVGLEAFRWLVNLEAGPYDLAGELVCEAWSPDLAALQRQALANRPALRMMETVVRLREQAVAAAGAGVRPSVRAHGTYEGADPYGFGTAQGGWDWHWNAGLSLTWTLWDGALTHNVVAEKEIELEKSRADLDNLRRAIALEVQQAYLELAAARETVQAGADSVAMAEHALEIAKARYDAGLATRLEFTDATLQLSTARLLRCTALHDHMAAAARLRYAAGLDGTEMKPENRP